MSMTSETRIRGGVLGQARRTWRHGDRLYQVLLLLSTAAVLALVLGIALELWRNSALSRAAFGWNFLVSSKWDPALTDTFGALPYILGTLITATIALLGAVPLGLGAAIFLTELAPDWLARPLGFLADAVSSYSPACSSCEPGS